MGANAYMKGIYWEVQEDGEVVKRAGYSGRKLQEYGERLEDED